jgi:hypothetical protein
MADCSVRMLCPVVMQCFPKCKSQIVAVLTPNVISCLASDDDGNPIGLPLAIPLQQNDGTICLKLFDFRNELVDHVRCKTSLTNERDFPVPNEPRCIAANGLEGPRWEVQRFHQLFTRKGKS